MHYWNQDNFQSLTAIAEAYADTPGYEGFAAYCQLRERGLKKPALQALADFIAACHHAPLDVQRERACELAALHYHTPAAHQLLAQPLRVYLGQILEAWCQEAPPSPVPYRWAAVIKEDTAYFHQALEQDPNDAIALYRLAVAYLGQVDYQTHHLGESFFIGDEAHAETALARAGELIARLAPEQTPKWLAEEQRHCRALLDAWARYHSADTSASFPEWCEAQGLVFGFSQAFYYAR